MKRDKRKVEDNSNTGHKENRKRQIPDNNEGLQKTNILQSKETEIQMKEQATKRFKLTVFSIPVLSV